MRSLAGRLIAGILAFALLAMVGVALWLTAAYRDGAERDFDAVLEANLYNVIGALEFDETGTPAMADDVGDPRFAVPLSGWYWAVLQVPDLRPLVLSRSTAEALPPVASDEAAPFGPDFRRSYVRDREDGGFTRHLEARLYVGDGDLLVQIVMAADTAALEENVANFARRVALSFLIVALGLTLVTLLSVRIGLLPLQRVRRNLARVRAGEAARLDVEVPSEIEPLVREVNALVDANAAMVDRARMQAGNLAHALKTPLAVVRNEACGDPTILAQVERMEVQLRSQLDRAMLAARRASSVERVDVAATLEGLRRTLARLFPGLSFELDVDGDVGAFRGSREDLQEMVGNLLENAGRFARERVLIRCARGETGRVIVEIEDDGPGLSAEERTRALRRGERLDASDAGSGLGLDIVREAAADYGGALNLSRSRHGGLRATLVLPSSSGKPPAEPEFETVQTP